MSTGNQGVVLSTDGNGIGFRPESAIYPIIPRQRLEPVTDDRPYGVRRVEERQEQQARNHMSVALPIRRSNLD